MLGAREAPGGILGSLGSPRGYASDWQLFGIKAKEIVRYQFPYIVCCMCTYVKCFNTESICSFATLKLFC